MATLPFFFAPPPPSSAKSPSWKNKVGIWAAAAAAAASFPLIKFAFYAVAEMTGNLTFNVFNTK